MTVWERWVRQPQNVWLRKALFQVHLWTGIGVGLYVFGISLTGSVLVYRNELYRAATPTPIISTSSGSRLTDDQLKEAATRVHPGYTVTNIVRARNLNQSVDVSLERGNDRKKRLFDPYTGNDLGNSVGLGIWLVSTLLDLHDNLLTGTTGRAVNGFGALFIIALTLTGIVIWWPGIKNWCRSLTVYRTVNWKRFTWDVHSMMGFWTAGFILLFAITGTYLSFPETFQDVADFLQPLTAANAGDRFVDQVTYWLAYLHFGRFGGRIPGCRATCNSTFKVVWAVFGLVPACMFVTGALMWWNRVLRKGGRVSDDEPTAPRLASHELKAALASGSATSTKT